MNSSDFFSLKIGAVAVERVDMSAKKQSLLQHQKLEEESPNFFMMFTRRFSSFGPPSSIFPSNFHSLKRGSQKAWSGPIQSVASDT